MTAPAPDIDFTELLRMLDVPAYRATTWTAHCGCKHEAGSTMILRCPEHAKLL